MTTHKSTWSTKKEANAYVLSLLDTLKQQGQQFSATTVEDNQGKHHEVKVGNDKHIIRWRQA